MKRSGVLVWLFSLGALLFAGGHERAFGLDPAKSIHHFNSRNWTRQNGLPVDKVNSVVQGEDGYIWLGTQGGLVRYDGQTFQTIPLNLPDADGQEVRHLAASRDGGVWFAIQDGGFGGYRAGEFFIAGDEKRSRFDTGAAAILEAQDRAVWMAGNVSLSRWVAENPEATFYDDSSILGANALMETATGRVWVGTLQRGLHYWEDGALNKVDDPELNVRIIYALAEDPAGRLWIGTERGLRCLDAEGRVQHIPFELPEIRALLVDRHGVLWIGTTSMGLARIKDGEMTFLTKVDGLVSDNVRSLAEDAEGSLWVGTEGGLSQLSDVRFPIYSNRDGILDGSVHTVAASRDGGLWITTNGGVSYFDGKNARNYGAEFPLPNPYIKNGFEARNGDVYLEDGERNLVVLSGDDVSILDTGNMWPEAVAEDNEGVLVGVGPTLCRVHDGQLQPYVFDGEKPELNWINNLVVARDGAIWTATNTGVFRIQNGAYRRWAYADGLPTDKVYYLCEVEDGSMWVGTASGLVRISGDEVSVINVEKGLFDNRVYAIVPDRLGHFWINSGRGIFRLAYQELSACADGTVARVHCDAFDGLESVKFNDRTDQGFSGCITADGRIWFPNPRGVVMIDPGNYIINEVPPPVYISEVRINGVLQGEKQSRAQPAGDARAEFHFTALSFFAPDKVQVRYQLEGFDDEWVEAGNRRSALYNKLSPGPYVFRVQACNADGVWNTAGDEFDFVLPPPFYQTTWFRLLCAMAVVLLLTAGFRWRVARMRAHQRELEAQNNELEASVLKRTEELARANLSLQGEIDQRKQTELHLKQRTLSLESEIEERKRMQQEVERVHRTLVETSRKAGMAEVATSVLHNVGNVLNSVNVSATVLAERLDRSDFSHLKRVCQLLKQHQSDLGDYLTQNPQGRKVPAFLETLENHLATERGAQIQEIQQLRKNVEHIKEIVAMQQAYAKVSGVTETLAADTLVEDALRISAESFTRCGIRLVRDFQATPTITVDKHKVLQILVNLIRNAEHACEESDHTEKTITVRITASDEFVQLAVSDTGVGISAESLPRIFSHGFTTRKEGHGFGLHSGALAAKEMGGAIRVHSDGPGKGALFTLELPLRVEAPAPVGAAV